MTTPPRSRAYARTTDAEREAMRQLFHFHGIRRATIARAFGVSYSTVWSYTNTPYERKPVASPTPLIFGTEPAPGDSRDCAP